MLYQWAHLLERWLLNKENVLKRMVMTTSNLYLATLDTTNLKKDNQDMFR